MNVSKQKRDDLVAKIKAIRSFVATAPMDENTGNLLTYLSEIEKDVKAKKYGLVFEEHREAVDDVLETHIPVLTEEKDLFIDKGGQINFLIEGDNLATLRLLEKTHRDSINLIYIDPPYNTEKEGFIYSDTLVDGNDTFRHSKWLSFMTRRLEIAKKLLSSRGVIFVSVDENEFAQLKMLMDNIFGEKNFIECLVWNKRVPKNDKGIGNVHEYILLYAKSADFKYKFMMPKDGLEDITALVADCKKKKIGIEETEKKLKQLYKKKAYDRAITLYNGVDSNYRVWGKINMSWPNGNTFGPRYDVLHPITKKPVNVPDRGWRWSEETFNKAVDFANIQERFDGSYMCGGIWFAKDENMQPSSIKYLDDVDRMLLRSIVSLKSDGSIEIEKYFNKKSVFAYPKPTTLMKLLIDSITYDTPDCTVLDFFAGSGTTAQAVMALNLEDNGTRKFIMCTNNQNEICRQVTYKRLSEAITVENYMATLKYYRVEFVPISEQFYYEYADDLLLHIRELVELENGVNFLGNAEIAIVLNDDELMDFVTDIDSFKKCHKLYIGHNVLPNGEQTDALKKHNITVNVIPNYYYNELEV